MSRPTETLTLPEGLKAFSIEPDGLPVTFEHPHEFTDIRPGDVLLVMPDAAGRYAIERDGQFVIVGILHGCVQTA